jgi:RNA-binding protein
MKLANRIKINVFVKPEEDEQKIVEALKSLLPFDLEKEKIILKKSTAQGFNERKIIIYDVVLEKESQTNTFLKFLKQKLNEEQRQLLVRQENRLDDDCCFYMRIDKQKLFNNELYITDEGECFHITFCVAAFPKKKECAREVVKRMFSA